MEDAQKLRVLIEHWIEHNASHREEFEKWAQRASEWGLGPVSEAILDAAGNLKRADGALQNALAQLDS